MAIDMEPERTIATWYGRDIDQLSREELIRALKWLGKAYNDSLERNINSMEIMRLARRGD